MLERSRSGAAQCGRALPGASCPCARMVPPAERGNLVRLAARPTSPFSRFSCPGSRRARRRFDPPPMLPTLHPHAGGIDAGSTHFFVAVPNGTSADYLLKPFNQERFDEALEQAKDKLGTPTEKKLNAIVEESQSMNRPLERILIRDGTKVHIIPSEHVDYIEAQDDYVSVKAGGKSYCGTLGQ